MNKYNNYEFRQIYRDKAINLKKYIDSIVEFNENDIFDIYQEIVNDRKIWNEILPIIENKYKGKEEKLIVLKDIICNPLIAKY